MTKSITIDFGTWNAGRTKNKTVAESKRLFTVNFTRVHRRLRDGFCFCQEWDEADKADEHGISAKIASETHKWLRFPSAVPVMVPDEFRILRKPLPRTLKMSDGIARWSPHRVLTKGLVALHTDKACRFIVGSTHIMRKRDGKANKEREKHINRLRRQFRYAEAKGLAMIIGLDGNDGDLPELHPKQKVLYHRGLDYIIAIDGETVKFKRKTKETVDTTIDGHNLGVVTVEVQYEEGE